VNVATIADLATLQKRVRILEARAERKGSEWMRLSASPLGARKLRRLIVAGKMEASRVGRLLFVRIDEHDRFLEQRVVKREAPKPVPVETEDAAAFAAANLHLLRRAG
jgi:hypothetical protein